MCANRKLWTEEEELFLQNNWGAKSINNISKKLSRSYNSVANKANKLGLQSPTLHYDGITIAQLSKALGVYFEISRMWINKYNLPAKKKVFSKKLKVEVITYKDFWEWAEQHKHLINFAHLEPYILGIEPEWVKEKREIDKGKFMIKKPWTKKEVNRLINLVNSYKYTYPEIAELLKRPEASIQNKLVDLNIKARPLSLNKHIKYTDEEVVLMIRLLDKGYSFEAIANVLNEGKPSDCHKSVFGIKGKLKRMGFVFKSRNLPVAYPINYKKMIQDQEA